MVGGGSTGEGDKARAPDEKVSPQALSWQKMGHMLGGGWDFSRKHDRVKP